MATESSTPDESWATAADQEQVRPKPEPSRGAEDETRVTTTVTRGGNEANDDPQPGPSRVIENNEATDVGEYTVTESEAHPVRDHSEDPRTTTEDDRIDGDKFVLLNPYSEYNKVEKLRNGFYLQMEKVLKQQAEQCSYYKAWFEQQNNEAMMKKFATYETCSQKYLDLLKESYLKKEMLPAHKWEQVSFNCIPVNADVREKEVQLVIKSTNLEVSNTSNVYIIGEFEFQVPKDEPIKSTFSRWIHHVRIEPKLICCVSSDSRQLDIAHAMDVLPFDKPESRYTGYSRPISFHVDKGRSRTLKRKFKPVKLTFYEKRYLRKDRKIGSVQIKIDQINDVSTSVVTANLMDGRRELEATADIRIRVREPLVDKSIRAHEERILHLT